MAEGPFKEPHILYNIQGAMPSGEIWSVGLRTIGGVQANPANMNQAATDLYGPVNTFWGVYSAFVPASVTMSTIKVSNISTAGKVTATGEFAPSTPLAGGSPNAIMPNQCALVATLRTNTGGRTGRGRIYLPFNAAPLVPLTARVRPADAATVATAVATLLQDLSTANTAGPVPIPIAVQSRATPPNWSLVTRVQVGDVVDTQRRRRDKEIEIYASHAVVIPTP